MAVNAETGEIIDAALVSMIQQTVEKLRSTFARFVEASPTTCPPYHSVAVPFRKANLEISLRPNPLVANRYRVTLQDTRRNGYGIMRNPEVSDIQLIGGTALYVPTLAQASKEEIGA